MSDNLVRIPRKIKTFEYNGEMFGVRPPATKEQEKITQLMADYQRSLKAELRSDKEADIVGDSVQTGDLTLLTQCQKYAAQELCCVHDNSAIAIFKPKNDNGEDIDNVPADFISKAWFCLTDQNQLDRRRTSTVQDLFSPEWVKANSYVDEVVIRLEVRRLEMEDPATAHKIRIALDIAKTEDEKKPKDPTPPETRT